MGTHFGWREIQCVNNFLLLKLSTISNLLFVIQQYGFGLDGVMGFPYLWTELAEKTYTDTSANDNSFRNHIR
jgi:hypothetical protein